MSLTCFLLVVCWGAQPALSLRDLCNTDVKNGSGGNRWSAGHTNDQNLSLNTHKVVNERPFLGLRWRNEKSCDKKANDLFADLNLLESSLGSQSIILICSLLFWMLFGCIWVCVWDKVTQVKNNPFCYYYKCPFTALSSPKLYFCIKEVSFSPRKYDWAFVWICALALHQHYTTTLDRLINLKFTSEGNLQQTINLSCRILKCGLWEEAEESGENSCTHRENMHTPHSQFSNKTSCLRHLYKALLQPSIFMGKKKQ